MGHTGLLVWNHAFGMFLLEVAFSEKSCSTGNHNDPWNV